MRRTGAQPLVVRSRDLWEALRPTVEQQDKDRAASTLGGMKSLVLSGHGMLAELSGIGQRRVHSIFERQNFVTLELADALLTAVGLSHHLQDGTIPVIPNPGMGAARFRSLLQQAGINDTAGLYDDGRSTGSA